MKITVVGVGNVGGTLGARFAEVGHEVVFAVRNPSDPKHRAMVQATKSVALPMASAAAGSSMVVLATPWANTQEAVGQLKIADGTIVVDATNPIAADFSGLSIGQTTSGAEQVATWVRNALVVKCFNSVGYEVMKRPKIDGRKAAMFVAGDDEAACATVAELSNAIGFETIVAGKLTMARQLEQLAWLWIHLSVKRDLGRAWAFSVVKP